MSNILLVEDDESLRQLMSIHLLGAGYNVYEAGNSAEAHSILDTVVIHLMITVMMPGIDGYELTGELRSANNVIPVLIVTKKGADDYRVNPISIERMLLRVETLIRRRSNLSGESILSLGKTTLNLEALMVTCNDKSIVLPQKEFLILRMLLSYPKRIFTRQALMDEIWGYESESDPRTVDVHIKRLRGKFRDSADFEIETVWGLGYKAVIKR